MSLKRSWIGCLFVLALVPSQPAAGQLPGGGSLGLPISLGGLLGNLTVGFEHVTGLNLLNLGATIQLVSPTDAGLLARLPAGVTIPSGFPILVHIEPPAAGGLLFNGIASLELHTLNLSGAPAGTTRMYAASSGGLFSDVTSAVKATGLLNLGTSYRVIGSRGGFSEFLIVNDPTPAAAAVAGKLDQLDQILSDHGAEIAAPVRATLAAQLATVRGDVGLGNKTDAITHLNTFLSTVALHSGTDIPDVWRAARDLTDVAGLLRAAGNTLLYSLQALGS